MNQLETVVLEVNIQRGANGTEFSVLQTPLALWNALPQKAKRVDAGWNFVHLKKEFVITSRGKRYVFVFYRSEGRQSP
jgi:hypothetical protein